MQSATAADASDSLGCTAKGGAFFQLQILPRQLTAQPPKCSRERRPDANAGKVAGSGAGITAKGSG